jgi:hypothetical protein
VGLNSERLIFWTSLKLLSQESKPKNRVAKTKIKQVLFKKKAILMNLN